MQLQSRLRSSACRYVPSTHTVIGVSNAQTKTLPRQAQDSNNQKGKRPTLLPNRTIHAASRRAGRVVARAVETKAQSSPGKLPAL
jgi:hypothetical protein